MHVKYLALIALSSAAVAQDWYEDAMDALESNTPVPSGVSDDVPTLDEYMDDHPSGIDVTNDFGSSSDDSNTLDDTSSSSSSSGSTSSYDDDEDEDSSSSSSGTFGGVPDDIASQLVSAIPPSVISEIMNPTSLASLQSEVENGNFPAWATDLPDDVKDYLETEWDVEVPAAATSSVSSGDDDVDDSNSDSNSNSDSSNDRDDDQDGAGMLSPSVFGSIVGAAGVLAVALAL
ncbi:hypothetical protein BDV06DRAFT_220601 [Aspergillus oleicola]